MFDKYKWLLIKQLKLLDYDIVVSNQLAEMTKAELISNKLYITLKQNLKQLYLENKEQFLDYIIAMFYVDRMILLESYSDEEVMSKVLYFIKEKSLDKLAEIDLETFIDFMDKYGFDKSYINSLVTAIKSGIVDLELSKQFEDKIDSFDNRRHRNILYNWFCIVTGQYGNIRYVKKQSTLFENMYDLQVQE